MNPHEAKRIMIEALDSARHGGTIEPAWLADAIEQAIDQLT